MKKVIVAATLAVLSLQMACSRPDAVDYEAFRPDPKSVKFILPGDIPWTGEEGRYQEYLIYGNPSEDGPYAMLLKWWPNQFSNPHVHNESRYVAVLSGTWWMSSSAYKDIDMTYPIPAGSVVVHEGGQVHWDGAKDEPVVIMISGQGPVISFGVDEAGNRKK